jgi:1-acyl-sn-glycerol-3-phosphate acyltransferase
MKGLIKHPLRVSGRLVWLCAELTIAGAGFMFLALFRRCHQARSRWLQRCCKRLLPVFGIACAVTGTAPTSGLLVSNHLSYLDIVVFGALGPAVFIAKREVKSWPVFGWLAILAGTVFVDRRRRSAVRRSNEKITGALEAKQLVVLFPEGTSTDGSTVLPFKSSLLAPVLATNMPITTACMKYTMADGDVAEEVCYWKDMTLVPHLINLLSKKLVRSFVCFDSQPTTATNRKVLAVDLHLSVLRIYRRITARTA